MPTKASQIKMWVLDACLQFNSKYRKYAQKTLIIYGDSLAQKPHDGNLFILQFLIIL